MDHPHPEREPRQPEIAPRTQSNDIVRLALAVRRLMRSGQTALDAELLQALVELGNEAGTIARLALAQEHEALLEILQDLHGYGHFDPTGTECDDAFKAAKRRARRAACGAPGALWDPLAERAFLEAMLAAGDERALDQMVLDLADASGYLALIEVSWRHWHYGRHAEQAVALGMEEALERLFSAAWQIQHHVVGAADAKHAHQERERLRAAHRALQETAASQGRPA